MQEIFYLGVIFFIVLNLIVLYYAVVELIIIQLLDLVYIGFEMECCFLMFGCKQNAVCLYGVNTL